MAEDLIEAVEMALVLHQGGAGEIVEILDAARRVGADGLEKRQVLLEGNRNLGGAKLGEKSGEHEGLFLLSIAYRDWSLEQAGHKVEGRPVKGGLPFDS